MAFLPDTHRTSPTDYKEIALKYANHTTVPASKSRAEIERLVLGYAGRDASFSYGQGMGKAMIFFVANGRRVKFVLPLPTYEEGKVASKRKRQRSEATKPQIEAWMDTEERRRWRSLLLAIKAKLETVQTGIFTFEEEFLSHIITGDDDKTIFEKLVSTEAGHKILPALDVKQITDGSRKHG
jgi:hypothetical protein